MTASVRRVAVAIPVKNEAADLPACLRALAAAAGYAGLPVMIVALCNDCTDDSAEIVRAVEMRHASVVARDVAMLPGARHAGWARRLALDAAADLLCDPGDLLMSTDADTMVATDWITRTIAHLDAGADAVAGRALTRREERAGLGERAFARLNMLGRYYTALDYLRAAVAPERRDPWPRHYYEGGASIALTLGLYRRIGGAPTPPLAEDRALFARIVEAGGTVRHPLDVRVFTSCRLAGRAPGGMADAVAGWIAQGEDAPLHEVYAIGVALTPGQATAEDRLSFRTLPAAIAEAQARIAALRSATLPEVEAVAIVPCPLNLAHRIAQQGAKFGHGFVAGQRIVGVADPVDQQHVAA